MFTSEPNLTQRIERMISDVPIVDTRSNLAVDRLGATDLASLIDELPVRVALKGAGMTTEGTDPTRSPDERVVLALPFLRQIRNTSPAWCLFRIFRDLYDFDEPHLTLDNYQGLMDRVARSSTDLNWPRHVIHDRAKVTTLVAPPSSPSPENVEVVPDSFVFRLEIIAAGPFELTPRIRTRVFEELDEEIEGPVRFVAFPEPPDLDNPVHAAVLEWHDLHQLPIQVVLDQHAPSSNLLKRIESVVLRYPQAQFGLMTGSGELGPEVAAWAGRLPNVFADGFSGLGAVPMVIERNVLARVQQAGASKIGGFASGASSAEWVYGSLQATKKATASALAQVVSGGFFEEDALPPLLQAVFHTSPTAWYRLKD